MKVIEVVISPKGETEVKTSGYSGSSCQQASKFVEDALGVRSSETKTSEFHQSSQSQQQQATQ